MENKNGVSDSELGTLEYSDDMGHRYGDSPQLDSAVQMTDQQIGRLWDAIQYRQATFKEQWMIIITTDHGSRLLEPRA